MVIQPESDNQILLKDILVRREYYLVEELASLGCSFLPIAQEWGDCNLILLIKHGFASLLEKIGMIVAESRLDKGDWHAFGNRERPGLWFAERDVSNADDKAKNPIPFLLEAVLRKLPNMDVIRLLTEKFAVDINEQQLSDIYKDDQRRVLACHCALSYVANGNEWWHVHQALLYLIRQGADVYIRDHNGQTPLHIAIASRGMFSNDAVKILIEAGANVNAVDNSGMSCLAHAQHDVNVLKLLTSNGATPTADALYAAIGAENLQVVQTLLSAGLDPNIRPEVPTQMHKGKPHGSEPVSRPSETMDDKQFTPFHFAARATIRPWQRSTAIDVLQRVQTMLSVVQVLLDYGADPFAKFVNIGMPTDDKTIELTPVNEVPNGQEEYTVLHSLFMENMLPDTILRLPKLDVNHRDSRGRTLLHAASFSQLGLDHILGPHMERVTGATEGDRVTVFQRLLAYNIDLRARDNFGRNVLHYLANQGYSFGEPEPQLALIHILDKAPDLVNQQDGNGNTPLHLTIFKSVNLKTAQLLLSNGADPLLINNKGDTVLHLLANNLCHQERRDLVMELVGQGIDINARNAKGETPLFQFCNRTRVENDWLRSFFSGPTEEDAIPILQQLGADFAARDNTGRGLLHVAAGGDDNRFKQLLALGLDPMLEDDAHQTAIDVAAACANLPILELFEKKN